MLELATWLKDHPILMHISVARAPYKHLIDIESPGRGEVTTSTNDSRIRTVRSNEYPVECKVRDRERACTHEQVTDGVRGVDGRPCNSHVDDTTGCNHQLGARFGPRPTQIARTRGITMQIPHTEHA